MTELDGIRKKVFLDRYALKAEDGSLLEQTPQETWKRVAKGIAANEKRKDRAKWEEQFYKIMEDFKFVPGGRILSGAGSGYQVTYFNCFVIPSPKDSRHGILDSLGQLVEIQARSGGVGLNLSSLRPKGARVKKVNGTSSGPVNWATLFSVATHDIVQQGGSRRGATMLMLWDWHPDIEEFITIKQDLTKINGANLSVCISDEFMEAVKNGLDWDLVYPDLDDPRYDELWDGDLSGWKAIGGKTKVYKTVKAKDLWDLICTAAWRSAEPGLHFLGRSNKLGNTWYFEKLLATNPCLTSDTWIHTDQGARQITDLLNKPFIARIDGIDYKSAQEGFFKSGTKPVIKITTKEGYSLRLTANHRIQRIAGLTRYVKKTEWCEAGSLQAGDRVILHNHQSNISWDGAHTKEEGYLLGLLIGDGTLKVDKAILSVWKTSSKINQLGYQGIMTATLHAANSVPHRKDFIGWQPVNDRDEYRLSLGYVKSLAKKLGMEPGNKTITPAMEKTSSNFYQGLLRGLYDADGSVQGTQAKGISIRLAQSDLRLLETVQRMLLRLGIVSKIYKNRRFAGIKMLPDGKGSKKQYITKAQHELIISGENLLGFYDRIGFGDSDKSEKLKKLLGSYKRMLNKEDFAAEVQSITPDGVEDVFDVQVPGINAFDANGFYSHNCGEQPLGAWAVCNLGAMNLSAYVKDYAPGKAGWFDYESFAKDAKIAMRFMDNVIDQTYYFFKENEKVAKDIRRTGLGIMGIGDTLIKMQIKYGSEESLPVIEKIFRTLRDSAYEASADIALEKGAFPKYDKEKYLQGDFIKQLPEKIRNKIAKGGIRNAVLLTIAPTGTTSLVAGVSSGIEPVYEFSFKRKWRGGEDIMYHPLYEEWLKEHTGEEKPSYFVSANDLTPSEHVRVQAVAQKYIDSSISKTVNAPNAHTVDDVKTLYMSAYDMGLKGITYMRDGSRQGVLERIEQKPKDAAQEAKEPAKPIIPITPRVPRPLMLTGTTYKAETPVGKMYVTINHNEKDDPFEVFITNGKSGTDVMAMADALGRMISFVLRIHSTVPARERMREIVSELSGIGGARTVGFGENRVRSLPDAVSKVLARHSNFRVNGKVEDKPSINVSLQVEKLKSETTQSTLTNGHAANNTAAQAPLLTDTQQLPIPEQQQVSLPATNLFDICPECGSGSFAYEEGCKKCYGCGYSEC